MPTLDSNPTYYVTPEREAEYSASNYNFRYKAGINNVTSYQVSGFPFVSSSNISSINFPSVSTSFTVYNTNGSNPLYLSFSANGYNTGNYFRIAPTSSLTMNVKATTLYFNGTSKEYSIAAELTGITGYDLAAAYSGSVGIG
jgi:hypothetical protein